MLVRGAFPGWWKEWVLRPVLRMTPGVARLQGVTAIGLGSSLVAIGLSSMVSDHLAGLLVVIAMATYLIGAGIFVYSTWLSRRGLAS
jgi:predicted transporter